MKSNNINDQEEKFKKATELLQKSYIYISYNTNFIIFLRVILMVNGRKVKALYI